MEAREIVLRKLEITTATQHKFIPSSQVFKSMSTDFKFRQKCLRSVYRISLFGSSI